MGRCTLKGFMPLEVLKAELYHNSAHGRKETKSFGLSQLSKAFDINYDVSSKRNKWVQKKSSKDFVAIEDQTPCNLTTF